MTDNLAISSSPTYKLWLANKRQQSVVCHYLAKFDLTYVEFVALSVLVLDMPQMPGMKKRALKHAEITRLLQLNKKTAAQTMRSLNKKQLIWRLEDIFDTRSFVIRPTGQGAYIFRLAHKVLSQLDHNLSCGK